MSDAYVITILVVEGDPDGVRVVEKSNWTGKGVVFSRGDLAGALTHGLGTPGIYVLIGDDPDEGFDRQLYIGQSEDVGVRLKQHQGDDRKEFWNDTIVFVSGNQSLNRAHISYLEANLVKLAGAAKRVRLANGNAPSEPSMTSVDSAVAGGFLNEMLAIFPILGVDAFDLVASKEELPRREGRIRYYLDERGAKAEGEERSDGFLVFEGAIGPLEVIPSFKKGERQMRERAVSNGQFVRDGDSYRLTEDILLKSPSAAASLITGSTTNGLRAWQDADGVSLKEHQIREAEQAGTP